MPARVAAAATAVMQKKKAAERKAKEAQRRGPEYDSAAQFLESTGRSIYSEQERREQEANRNRKLAQALTERRAQAAERMHRKTHGLPHQNWVKDFYDRKAIQIFVAGLIIMNFFVSAIEAQIFPLEKVPGKDDAAILIFTISEYFFAYVFLLELIVNFYGNYFWQFWKSAWNIFDFLIVLISLLALYMKDLPGISVLRLFRAFRVVRLFKRIKTMRVMMDSILRSLPGMSIAFIALFLIMGIYGIIGVNFWAVSEPKLFGNFLKAVLSLLQIMTFDSWASGIARDIILGPEGGAVAAVYFITYVFIASIIMANVLIALLLDEFMNTSSEERSGGDDDSDAGGDEVEELDKITEDHHAKLEEKLLNPETRHSGFVSASLKAANLFAQSGPNTQGNIVQGNSRENSPPSANEAGIEMTNYRKNNPPNSNAAHRAAQAQGRAISPGGGYNGGSGMDEETAARFAYWADHSDPAWRAKVDTNIRTLTRSLDKLHHKLDQLLPGQPDYLT